MKKKVLMFLILSVLAVCLLSLAFAAPPPVTNLKAKGEMGQVRLTWTKASGAEGYIIYRQVGKGAFSYRYITPNGGFLDKTASVTQWNFYRVYPYKTINGKRVVGVSNRYVYAKAIQPSYNGSVTGLKATPNLGHNTISWNKLTSADGYSVFRLDRKTNSFKHLKTVVGTSYDDFDMNPVNYEYEIYRVYPFKRINGVAYFGKSTGYVYAKPEYYSKYIRELRGYRHPHHSDGTAYFQWEKADEAAGYVVRKIDHSTREGTIVAITTNTAVKLTGLDPKADAQLYYVHPYIYVKGRRVLGSSQEVMIRAYGKPGEYYSGNYKVGTDIPVGTYKILADSTDGAYFFYRKGSFIDGKVVRKSDPPVIEKRLQRGDLFELRGAIATKQ